MLKNYVVYDMSLVSDLEYDGNNILFQVTVIDEFNHALMWLKVQTLHLLEDRYSTIGSFSIVMQFYTQSFHCYSILEYIYKEREGDTHSVLGFDESQMFNIGLNIMPLH